MTNIGILTGGGDCPGLNAVIRAVAKKLLAQSGLRLLGIADGFEGLIRDELRPLGWDQVSGILTLGGTILGTSNRGNLQGEEILKTYRRRRLDGIVAIGGDGTLGICRGLARKGMRFVCVPKTIDNDVPGTDRTFGFDTAVAVVSHALDALHTTADAHRRVMVVEVMGRSAGWIALYGGVAGGADVILMPEIPFDLERVGEFVRKRHRTRRFTIVVVAEGARPGAEVARELERLSGFESRVTVLGHLQRGGTPTASDRILATRYGVAAAELVLAGQWNRMVALRESRIRAVSIASLSGRRPVPADHELVKAAESIGTCFGRK